MNWFFLALLAPAIYTVNVFLDKYLIEAKIRDYRSLPIFGVIVAIFFIATLSFFEGFGLLNFRNSLLIILTGIVSIWAFSLYLEALIIEEGSMIIILLQLVPIFVLILSFMLLGERLDIKQFIGFGLLIFAAIAASWKKTKTSFKFSRALFFIILADILWAIPYVLVKFVSTSISFFSLVVYESIGIILGGIFLYLFVTKIRIAFIKTITTIKKPTLGLVFLNECIFLLGKILTYFAVILGPATLVSVLGSIQVFFGVLFGTCLTLIAPKIFKESISPKDLQRKAGLGLIVLLGIWFIS